MSNQKMKILRPTYHFTAPKGWINDPNGLIQYKGKYHLFYQHNPDSCDWSSMHWGHAVSSDLILWEHLPIALHPDMPYDSDKNGGCFSGSSIGLDDGTLGIVYTGSVIQNGKVIQTQNLAFSEDGITFYKYPNNPIIDAFSEKEDQSDFRDPKVFAYDGKWYLVAGVSKGGTGHGEGRVLLYSSNDLKKWDYCGVLFSCEDRWGTMCECPDFFQLGDYWVLTFSPMYSQKMEKSLYVAGTMDFSNYQFSAKKIGVVDYGFDFYGSQSFLADDGRRIIIGWQNGWEWMPWFNGFGPTESEGWRGSMSFPRMLELDENLILRQSPINELDNILENDTEFSDLSVTSSPMEFFPRNPQSFVVRINCLVKDISSRFIEIGIRSGNNRAAIVQCDFYSGVLSFDRSNADNYSTGRLSCPLEANNGVYNLQMLVDSNSVEIFSDDGRHCISATIYPEITQNGFWIKTPYKDCHIKSFGIFSVNSRNR